MEGGELVTHLWALLTHAGILDRRQRNVDDIENTEVDQPYSDQLSYEELSYGSALRLWRASSYLGKCGEGAAPATCAINQPSTRENCVQLGCTERWAILIAVFRDMKHNGFKIPALTSKEARAAYYRLQHFRLP
ncbi:hypothetical protein EJB05_40784, partial [Eragrostis curvula]